MAKNSATEARLGELHGKVAEVMIGALKVMDEAQERYLDDDQATEVPVVSAPLLSAITKFLSDNKITCAPEESAELSDLEKRLQGKRRRQVGSVVHLVEED